MGGLFVKINFCVFFCIKKNVISFFFFSKSLFFTFFSYFAYFYFIFIRIKLDRELLYQFRYKELYFFFVLLYFIYIKKKNHTLY